MQRDGQGGYRCHQTLLPEAIIAKGFGDQKDAEDAELQSTVDSRVIPGCGNKGKYQGTILVWMVLG